LCEDASNTADLRIARRGLVLILSSPSGAGKTTLTRALIEDPALGLTVSISMTTRSRRASEIEGRDYHFTDVERFEALRDHGELLEWAQVHGNYYGTPRRPVERVLGLGADMIFDIDYQGTRQVKEKLGDDAVTVFVLPPSMAELQHRLDRRAEDTAEVIQRRLAAARVEIARWSEYDYVIVNDDLDRSFNSLKCILAAERLKRTRQTGLEPFVTGLLHEGR
jgi:guanylate kinase